MFETFKTVISEATLEAGDDMRRLLPCEPRASNLFGTFDPIRDDDNRINTCADFHIDKNADHSGPANGKVVVRATPTRESDAR